MARAFGSFAVVLFPLCAPAIIRTQSPDSADLRAFPLPPDGCPWRWRSTARAAILLDQARMVDCDIFPGAFQGEGFMNWRTRSISGSIRFIRGIALNVRGTVRADG